MGCYLTEQLGDISEINELRGEGLMIGAEFEFAVAEMRKKLLFEHQIFTGSSSNKNTLRLLPPLNVSQVEIDLLIESLKKVL